MSLSVHCLQKSVVAKKAHKLLHDTIAFEPIGKSTPSKLMQTFSVWSCLLRTEMCRGALIWLYNLDPHYSQSARRVTYGTRREHGINALCLFTYGEKERRAIAGAV